MEARPGRARVFSRRQGVALVWYYDYRSANGMLRATGSKPTMGEAIDAVRAMLSRKVRR